MVLAEQELKEQTLEQYQILQLARVLQQEQLRSTDDSVYEGNETAGISVSGVSGGGASESGTQAVTITITDESAPTVTLATSATSIAENAGSSLTLTATLSVATTADVTVALSTSGTATEGTDYADGSGVVNDITISAGSTTGTVNFTPTDDSVYEGDETATIAVSGSLAVVQQKVDHSLLL